MLTANGIEGFVFEIIEKRDPVLLAYINRDYHYKEMSDALDSLANEYGGKLKVCLLNEKFSRAFKKYKIEGSPTFITFYKGEEMGRMLGKVDKKTLDSFIRHTFPHM